jgi:hypothetical protein
VTLLDETEKQMIWDTRERAFVFSPDGNTIIFIEEANEGKDVLNISKDKRKLCEGNILTHSHTEFGFGTFTNIDINFFFSNKVREIRMVKKQTVFSLIHQGSCTHDTLLIDLANYDLIRL